MQCSVTLERYQTSGNKMKTINSYKNPYRKEPNLDNIVDQLCTRLQDIKDQDSASSLGMPTCTLEHTEAVRRYYAAFPALKKGQESPLQFYPTPAWCRNTAPDTDIKMQSELSVKDWNSKSKKFSGKERRNSYHGQRKSNRKRCNSYSRSFESKDSLPEWMTHEGVWDIETQDPVKEFIRAIALDEGYGTCENTVTDDLKDMAQVRFAGIAGVAGVEDFVPEWDELDPVAGWAPPAPRARDPMEEELYARFEAKFDRSIEALWSKDQNTPDDEYQDLPIDFQDLLSSPSDRMFADPSAEKCSLISLTDSIWSTDGFAAAVGAVGVASGPAPAAASRAESAALHDRFRPLRLQDGPRAAEPFALYDGDGVYDSVASVADAMRSYAAINHSRDRSGFAEVPPRRRAPAPPAPAAPAAPVVPDPAPASRSPSRDREDLLTSGRTHFRPIRREGATPRPRRYADGDTFDIRGDLEPVEFHRSASGGAYLASSRERYLEYRASKTIDYGRLRLTEAQRCPDLDDPAFRLRFPLRQTDAAVQTSPEPAPVPPPLAPPAAAWAACEDCGRAAKVRRPSAMAGIWAAGQACAACAAGAGAPAAPPGPGAGPDADWDELLEDISAVHAEYLSAGGGAERKRRHSAALRAGTGPCSHPHARFLHCCGAVDRPLTR